MVGNGGDASVWGHGSQRGVKRHDKWLNRDPNMPLAYKTTKNVDFRATPFHFDVITGVTLDDPRIFIEPFMSTKRTEN